MEEAERLIRLEDADSKVGRLVVWPNATHHTLDSRDVESKLTEHAYEFDKRDETNEEEDIPFDQTNPRLDQRQTEHNLGPQQSAASQ